MVGPIDDTLRSMIRHKMTVEVTCDKCSRTTLLDAGYLSRKVDPRTRLHQLPLLCSQCFSRDFRARAYPVDWE
jgi:hypothetical protein